MQLTRARDLGHLVRDARLRLGWNQSQLAHTVGVSRQWISMVENGKTSVEFDLVLRALRALGYRLRADVGEPFEPIRGGSLQQALEGASTHLPSMRTSLTRHGRPLAAHRSRQTPNE